MATKKIKAWAMCFALNKSCMTGNVVAFTKLKEAKSYREELHKRIGGFVNDHHFVPCTITYSLPIKKITKKKH